MNIGQQIRKYRKESHLSQKELGTRLGVSQQNIAQYENGRRIPKLETIKKIAAALDIPLSELDPRSVEARSSHVPDVSCEERDPAQNRIMEYYSLLNDTGRQEAIKRMAELAEIPRYTKPASPPRMIIEIKAAHNDHLDQPGELERMLEDLEALKRPDSRPPSDSADR